MIDPYDEAAVVGGNVLTSQRLVDVILKAFEVCAASQVRVLIFRNRINDEFWRKKDEGFSD